MTIGIVIPTYNRLDNLKIILETIRNQTYQDFFVVIADDGSTDGTKKHIDEMANTPEWQDKIKWVGCGMNVFMRAGRTKNIGIANLPEHVEVFLSLDSDVVLPREALKNYAELYQQNNNAMVFGAVDWLPPALGLSELSNIIAKPNYGLESYIPEGTPDRVEGTFVGKEIRLYADFTSGKYENVTGKWALFLNTLIPRKVFYATKGYDENMKGYGYNDMEFGMQLELNNVTCIYSNKVKGYHIWHKKEQKRTEENQRNLDYFLQKHGYDEYYYNNIDWKYWWHYSYKRGGQLVSIDNELYVINNVRKDYLKLDSAKWIRKLGFLREEIQELAMTYLVDKASHGDAFETDIDSRY